MKRPRFDEVPVVPVVLALAAVAVACIAGARHLVELVDDAENVPMAGDEDA
jgi:hypothetical protein